MAVVVLEVCACAAGLSVALTASNQGESRAACCTTLAIPPPSTDGNSAVKTKSLVFSNFSRSTDISEPQFRPTNQLEFADLA